MKDNNHIIKQSFLDIELLGIRNNDGLAQEIIDYCVEVCFQDIDEQLKDYESGYFEIDSLEIDLGSFKADTWKDGFKKQFDASLISELECLPLKEILDGTKKIGQMISTQTSDASEKDKINEKVLTAMKQENEDGHYVKAYCFYLENGYFPWWYPILDSERSTLDEHLLHKKEYLNKIILSLKGNRNSIERFTMELPTSTLKQFTKLLGVNKNLVDGEKKIWSQLTKRIALSPGPSNRAIIFMQLFIENHEVLQGAFDQVFWAFLTLLISRPELQIRHFSDKKIEDNLFQLVNEFEIQWPILQNIELSEQKSSFLMQLGSRMVIRTMSEKINPKNKEKKSRSVSSPFVESRTQATDNSVLKQHSVYESPDNESAKVEEQEGVYVAYAGIVLFHPYLPSLFEQLQLTLNGVWLSKESKKKGVQLLAYISTGLGKCPEHKMLLFKFLCGLSGDVYVPSMIDLNSKEEEECKNLMKAVLNHWKVLGNVSLDGLREGFIERDGKLIKDKTQWKLIVEQKAQDVLLQQLPWGIGTIKLPWMKEMIWVHWI